MLCDHLLHPQKVYNRSRKVTNGNLLFFNINNEISHFFTFRKESYLKTDGINPNLSASEDFDLYLKLYEVGELAYIPKPLYFYRLHEQGISQGSSKQEKVHENWNKMLLEACKRRKISKIGKITLSEKSDLSKIIFQKENTLAARIKRKITRFL